MNVCRVTRKSVRFGQLGLSGHIVAHLAGAANRRNDANVCLASNVWATAVKIEHVQKKNVPTGRAGRVGVNVQSRAETALKRE